MTAREFTANEQKMIQGVKDHAITASVEDPRWTTVNCDMTDEQIFEAAQPAFTAKTAIKHVGKFLRQISKEAVAA